MARIEKRDEMTTNKDFCIPKIERNIQRDIEVTGKLEEEGWIVLRFWGKEIIKNLENCLNIIDDAIQTRK